MEDHHPSVAEAVASATPRWGMRLRLPPCAVRLARVAVPSARRAWPWAMKWTPTSRSRPLPSVITSKVMVVTATCVSRSSTTNCSPSGAVTARVYRVPVWVTSMLTAGASADRGGRAGVVQPLGVVEEVGDLRVAGEEVAEHNLSAGPRQHRPVGGACFDDVVTSLHVLAFVRPDLERVAVEHRNHLAESRAMERGTYDFDPASVETAEPNALLRWQVNYLRHCTTNYDRMLTLEAMQAAHRAIAEQYPWLAQEADRQTRMRAAEESHIAAMIEVMSDAEAEAGPIDWLTDMLDGEFEQHMQRDFRRDTEDRWWTGTVGDTTVVLTVERDYRESEWSLAVGLPDIDDVFRGGTDRDDVDLQDNLTDRWIDHLNESACTPVGVWTMRSGVHSSEWVGWHDGVLVKINRSTAGDGATARLWLRSLLVQAVERATSAAAKFQQGC